MFRSTKQRAASLMLAGAALLLGAAPAAAVTPTVDRYTVHLEREFLDCPGFVAVGTWDVSHKVTYFYDSNGVAIRDIEHVDFSGRIANSLTGAWVEDGGSRTFFDTLAPDGSYLTTYMVQVRKSAYLHTAGRTDFQTGAAFGKDGFTAAGIAALCDALDG